MSLDMFMLALMVTSVLTGLITEAIKKVLDESNKTYRSNMLAGIVSVVVSVLVSVAYVIIAEVALTSTVVVYGVILIIMSWLCAMVGYDKVIQAISQFKTTREDGAE